MLSVASVLSAKTWASGYLDIMSLRHQLSMTRGGKDGKKAERGYKSKSGHRIGDVHTQEMKCKNSLTPNGTCVILIAGGTQNLFVVF